MGEELEESLDAIADVIEAVTKALAKAKKSGLDSTESFGGLGLAIGFALNSYHPVSRKALMQIISDTALNFDKSNLGESDWRPTNG